jgi:hypothetical protein
MPVSTDLVTISMDRDLLPSHPLGMMNISCNQCFGDYFSLLWQAYFSFLSSRFALTTIPNSFRSAKSNPE